MKTKTTFDRIMEGLEEIKSIREGRKKPVAIYSLDPDARDIRELLGVSQESMASMIGVSVHTLRNWEQGRRQPEGAARVLLSMAAKEPQTVKRLVSAVHNDAQANGKTSKKITKKRAVRRKLVSV